MDEPFTLTRQPAQGRKRLRVLPKGNDRQGVLFEGGDCLPGQEDLFEETTMRRDTLNARSNCRMLAMKCVRITLDGKPAKMCGFSGTEAEVSAIDSPDATEWPEMCTWMWPDAERILLAGGDFRSDL